MITRYKEKQADLTKLQAQTLNNICSTNNYGTLTTPTTSNSCNLPMINDIYSTINRQNSANKTRQLASPTNGLEETYLDASISQKPMDLNHMVSTLDAAAKQTPNMQSTSIYAKSSYSNTLSMTRSKNNDNILSNGTLNEYTTKIANANNSNSNSDEHSLIASYCSRLAEFYAKNQHLSPSPTSSSPPALTPQPTSKFKSNMKPKTTFINDENPPSAYETLKSNRTSSLSRHAWSSNKYATNKPSTAQNGCDTPTGNEARLMESSVNSFKSSGKNTTRSLSECNFRTSENEDSSDSNGGDDSRQLKEKMELVAKLEQNNKELIKEINKLKIKQLSNRSLDLTDQHEMYQQLLMQQQQQITAHQSLKYQQQKMAKGAKDSTLTRKPNINSVPEPSADTPRYSTGVKSSLKKPNHEKTTSAFTTSSTMLNPTLIAELQTLKHKKGQLENRMHVLESSRDELIDRLTQLDSLMKPSKPAEQPRTSANSGASIIRTTPSNSPRGLANVQPSSPNVYQKSMISPVLLQSNISPAQANATLIPVVSASMAMQMPPLTQQPRSQPTQPRSWSTPSTPALYEFHPMRMASIQQQLEKQQQQAQFNGKQQQQSASLAPSASSLLSLASNYNGSEANGKSSSNLARCLRNDLLIAADSVTNAMQNLVKELNSENDTANTNSSDEEELNVGQSDFLAANNLESNDIYSDIRALGNMNSSLDNFKNNFTLNSSINSNTLDYTTANCNSANVNGKFNQPYSLSASATPVTYRKNANNLKLQLQQAQQQQQQLNLMFTNNINPFNIANNR